MTDERAPLCTLALVIGERARDLREAAKVTATDFAPLVEMTRRGLVAVELGERSPSVALIERIAGALDVHAAALLIDPKDTSAAQLLARALVDLVGSEAAAVAVAAASRSSTLGTTSSSELGSLGPVELGRS